MTPEDTKKLLEVLRFLADEFKHTAPRQWTSERYFDECVTTPINELYEKYCLNDVDKTEKQ